MAISACSRAVCAIVIAWVFAALNPATDVWAGGAPSLSNYKSTEPFGLFSSSLSAGGLREKWSHLETHLDKDIQILRTCEIDRAHCESVAALRFLAIIDQGKAHEGRARFGQINRAINLAIKPMSDLAQHGAIDVWSSPLATFASGAGDCEDYAIAKVVALRLAGVAADDLRLVILHDVLRDKDHAVVAARFEGRWLTLDNRHMVLAEDVQIANYQPTFLIDRNDVRRFEELSPATLDSASHKAQDVANLKNGSRPM